MCSHFPFLTQTEFEDACQALCTSASIRLLTKPGSGLRITQCINVPIPMQATDDPEEQEDDPEALVRISQPSLQVDYDILLSPTYQVPVLYFGLRWHNHGQLGLDAVYQYVVPEQYRQELKSVGVMGGISMGVGASSNLVTRAHVFAQYHPDSGAPAFFVHPCNTADAMAHIADPKSVTPGSYLLIWLGLVGHCVNLHVPRELFA